MVEIVILIAEVEVVAEEGEEGEVVVEIVMSEVLLFHLPS